MTACVCETWTTDGITYRELCRQDYANIFFSAGTREGPPRDGHERNEVFLRWDHTDGKGGELGTGGMLELTRDELAAIAWVANGTLWSVLEAEIE